MRCGKRSAAVHASTVTIETEAVAEVSITQGVRNSEKSCTRFQISGLLSKISRFLKDFESIYKYIYLLNEGFKIKIGLKTMLLDVHKRFYRLVI